MENVKEEINKEERIHKEKYKDVSKNLFHRTALDNKIVSKSIKVYKFCSRI